MMQIIPKWTVRLTHQDGTAMTLAIHAPSLMAALQKLAGIEFDDVVKVEMQPAAPAPDPWTTTVSWFTVPTVGV